MQNRASCAPFVSIPQSVPFMTVVSEEHESGHLPTKTNCADSADYSLTGYSSAVVKEVSTNDLLPFSITVPIARSY